MALVSAEEDMPKELAMSTEILADKEEEMTRQREIQIRLSWRWHADWPEGSRKKLEVLMNEVEPEDSTTTTKAAEEDAEETMCTNN